MIGEDELGLCAMMDGDGCGLCAVMGEDGRGLCKIMDAKTQRHFFSILHPLSTVHFATATVLAVVLLRTSRFNFHCYTQREATPTQKSARKCAATSRDFLRERLQSAFTLANQLR